MSKSNNSLWYDRKRTLFGLPWSFTKYRLSEDCLHIKTGFFNSIEEEVRLYRVLDITLRRSFWEKIFGLGTIHLCTADKSTPELEIKRIKNPVQVRNTLSGMIEKQRMNKGIIGREFFSNGQHSDSDGNFDSEL